MLDKLAVARTAAQKALNEALVLQDPTLELEARKLISKIHDAYNN